ncbi:hypothetical protein BD779DRAFT_1533052 [Infundibulicybe gibba]|nr:hypothetical protein BD779DRAFT_1533052 [Infundibulicybe gibba]
MQPPIIIPLHGPQLSSAVEYLSRQSTPVDPSQPESDLLRAIKHALRGSGAETDSSIRSTSFVIQTDPWEEEELTWDAHRAVLSVGGVIKKKWTFKEEKQSIQWACMGLLEQGEATSVMHANSRYTTEAPGTPIQHDSADRPTFGPFVQANKTRWTPKDSGALVPAVFIFLRNIGKIYLRNGLDYTFSLPFIVRKAWPISPHGVMIQRVLEPSELEEANILGDTVLPTIFSMTSPFSEAGAVGLTSGIFGGLKAGSLAALKDEHEHSTKPLKSVPPTEIVIWASHRGAQSDADIVVTLDREKKHLSVWRYAYVKPKDMPVPLTHGRTQTVAQKRESMSGIGNRRTSRILDMEPRERFRPLSPIIRSRDQSPPPEFPEVQALGTIGGVPPNLGSTTTMTSLVAGSLQWSAPAKGRRNSLTRNDLSMMMDKMAPSGRLDTDLVLTPIEHGRMKAAYWMELLYEQEVTEADSDLWRNMGVALFDHRWDGLTERSLISVSLPYTKKLLVLSLAFGADGVMKANLITQIPAVCAVSICATRKKIWDLLIVKPDYSFAILTHGLCELDVGVSQARLRESSTGGKADMNITGVHGKVVSIHNHAASSVVLVFEDGWKAQTAINLIPRDPLTNECLVRILPLLSSSDAFKFHRLFLHRWHMHNFSTTSNVEFTSPQSTGENNWVRLGATVSHVRFREDPAMRNLRAPPSGSRLQAISSPLKLHPLLGPVLTTLHLLAESFRFMVHRQESLSNLVPVILENIKPDDRVPVWPTDLAAILYGKLHNPEWKMPSLDVAERFQIQISYPFGRPDATWLELLESLYSSLADGEVPQSQKRAENTISLLVKLKLENGFLNRLPLGVAAPLREAARTCQLAPPGDWPLAAYRAICRDDLAASASDSQSMLFRAGYRSLKEYTSSNRLRPSIGFIVSEARAAGGGEINDVTGVELDLRDFTDIRFGQDRRLEEVARMLCSSNIPSIKIMERPELNEHDQTKEHQNQVIRIAERTLALPYGRGMFTFGSVQHVTREAYAIPEFEYTVRIQPLNITVSPEVGKIPQESLNWGKFHNGVAAGLRISPSSGGIEGSWIAFNKPSDLTPEHAGFLFGLGLTGHLKEMLTWHTFGYLTPKHDLTSIGVLLGLSAANVGSENKHVTKLLAVHTPALLPTPTIDLNVSLVTQAAGLAGVGLIHLGTKNRRMAEVCLNQVSRRDLVQPDLSNEHREAYTYSAALAFGMIMLGKGSMIPADMALISRMSILIHGDSDLMQGRKSRPAFDINLTSPAATIALGLMYLKTERQDVADLLTIPDTVISLNRIQPSFLLMRTIARSLIMWEMITPTNECTLKIREPVDDSLELAYYNILAGCCFAVGLKFAGTARQEAYMMIIVYFDLFTRLGYSNGLAYDQKIKRSAVRDGLNLISISLSMVMAGTGEITCFRRLRYAYGMYQQAIYHHPYKYGIHVATHMSLGLLFLGGGRFTLGTSDAAIACMVTAFFPRFHHISSDNKSFLQALRHLWVLAVEPRCLIARDVDTTEVVYLPVKITMKDRDEVGTTQLIAPTLIPDLDKLMSIRVDTPRYWPFYLDTEKISRHRESLLNSQTLFVKRRTAFLSYTEDPRGSRSLFVRSGSSAGDAATLDFPQLTDTKTHPAGDLSEFITSFSNDVLFLAFADHFSRGAGETQKESLFHTYCHATLLDSILQDKPQTLQSHLTLFRYRTMSPTSRFFHFKIYDRRFSGRSENNPRTPLIREKTVSGALHALDQQLNLLRADPVFRVVLGKYARGESVVEAEPVLQLLAWYLLRNGCPVSTLLVILKVLHATHMCSVWVHHLQMVPTIQLH